MSLLIGCFLNSLDKSEGNGGKNQATIIIFFFNIIFFLNIIMHLTMTKEVSE